MLYYKNIFRTIGVALVTLGFANVVIAAPPVSDFHIHDAEQVSLIEHASTNNNIHLSLDAYGQTLNLTLAKNHALMRKFSTRLTQVDLYTGKIDGVENSWVRLSKINGQYTGAIYDGNELLMIDKGDDIMVDMDSSQQTRIGGVKNVMYKASDVGGDATCGDHDADHKKDPLTSSKFSYKKLISQLKQRRLESQLEAQEGNFVDSNDEILLEAQGATEQVNIVIYADSQYVASSGSNGAQAKVMAQMNIVDGIFSEQVGVQFGIVDIVTLSNNGSLSSTNASTLLNQFRDVVRGNNPGLAHLFTGKNLDGSTAGIASLRSLCRGGVGLSQTGGSVSRSALVVAHEFGHNFGAPHDNQNGSACASTAGNFLMNPSINGSDQFSQCSLQQIGNIVNQANCLVPVENEPSPEEPEPLANCNFSNDASGFTFVDDPQSPAYSASTASNGSLNVTLGGVDDADISNMEGVWRQQCNSARQTQATINLSASLSQTSEYEDNEFSQVALRINGNITVLNTLTGDGNGGETASTGVQNFSTNVSLNAGINTIELVCFNNLKTFNNEVTNCSFTNIESSVDTASIIIGANFNNDFDGFSFEADASDPIYSDSERSENAGVNNSSALVTTLGGVDDDDITNMEANWTQSFNTSGGALSLTLDANLTQASNYEANESSSIGIRIDEQVQILNSISGDGNGGNPISTGFQRYRVNFNIPAGNHSLSLYCFNNAKTLSDENTTCAFDNIILE